MLFPRAKELSPLAPKKKPFVLAPRRNETDGRLIMMSCSTGSSSLGSSDTSIPNSSMDASTMDDLLAAALLVNWSLEPSLSYGSSSNTHVPDTTSEDSTEDSIIKSGSAKPQHHASAATYLTLQTTVTSPAHTQVVLPQAPHDSPSRLEKGLNFFVRQLFRMVNEESDTVVRWTESGTAFLIVDVPAFSQVVMPKYFRHGKMHSLIRQLNFYSFYKVSRYGHNIMYKHSHFLQHRQDLLWHIKRRRSGKAKDPWINPIDGEITLPAPRKARKQRQEPSSKKPAVLILCPMPTADVVSNRKGAVKSIPDDPFNFY